MYATLRAFSAYIQPYTRKNTRFPLGPWCVTEDGLETKLDNGKLKILHENERVGHGKLPGKNGGGFHRLDLPEFAF